MSGYRRIQTCGFEDPVDPCVKPVACTDCGAVGLAGQANSGFCTGATYSEDCPSTVTITGSTPALIRRSNCCTQTTGVGYDIGTVPGTSFAITLNMFSYCAPAGTTLISSASWTETWRNSYCNVTGTDTYDGIRIGVGLHGFRMPFACCGWLNPCNDDPTDSSGTNCMAFIVYIGITARKIYLGSHTFHPVTDVGFIFRRSSEGFSCGDSVPCWNDGFFLYANSGAYYEIDDETCVCDGGALYATLFGSNPAYYRTCDNTGVWSCSIS